MRKSLKWALFLGFAVIIGGCKTQSYLVDVYSTPALELPPETRGFLIFNRFVPAEGDYEYVQWGAYESVDSTLWSISDSCAGAFGQRLNELDHFRSKSPAGERMFRHNGAELPEPLPWEGLIRIAEKYYADGIVILESFGVTESEPKVSFTDSVFLAETSLEVMNGWRIYQPQRRRFLDETVYKTVRFYSASGQNAAEAIQNLPPREERILEAAIAAGKEYADLITPGKEKAKRKFYTKGHKVIEDAALLLEEGQWGKAESKWKYHAYNGETEELKAMCSYNMSILSEMNGQLNIALGFARRAQSRMSSKLHIDYINDLTLKLFQIEEMYKSGEVIRNW